MFAEGSISDGAHGAGRPAGLLRAAFAISLLLHGAGLYWLWPRNEPAVPERELRAFEVTLAPFEASRDARNAPVPVPDPEPEPEAERQVQAAETRVAAPRAAPAPRPRASAESAPSRRPLDLSLPADVVGPGPEAQAPPRGTGVFDPALEARIERARTRRPGPVADASPRTWDLGAGARTRIETERGCFERVSDAFDDRPGEQWWIVACGSAPADVDWGRRFRARTGDPR